MNTNDMTRRRRRRDQDPWTLVLERHITSQRPAGTADRDRDSGRHIGRPWLIGGAAGAVVLLGAVGALGALTAVNHHRADENLDRAETWQDRSEELQDLVGDRTAALNRQTTRLNIASNRLRSARRSIARSEADVEALEVRQRELAAEKAAVEDERAQVEVERDLVLDAATEIGECNSALIDVINDPAIDGPSPVLVSSANTECSEADDAVSNLISSGVGP